MSLITATAGDESPRDCSRKHGKPRRRALIAVSSALASLLSLAIILWLTLRPSSPPHFSLVAATATALPNTSVVAIDAAFTTHNPNAHAAALYDGLQARASYAGLPLAAPAPLPPLDQPQPQGDAVLSASLSTAAPPPSAGGAVDRAILRLRVQGQLRWKVGAWVSGAHALTVDCIAVVLSPRDVAVGLLQEGSARCVTTTTA